MNGIYLSWTILTHLVMGSLIGPMTLMRDMPLIPILMNLGITPKGQSKLSASWMTLHPHSPHVPLTLPTSMTLGLTSMLLNMRPLTMKDSGLILVGLM